MRGKGHGSIESILEVSSLSVLEDGDILAKTEIIEGKKAAGKEDATTSLEPTCSIWLDVSVKGLYRRPLFIWGEKGGCLERKK